MNIPCYHPILKSFLYFCKIKHTTWAKINYRNSATWIHILTYSNILSERCKKRIRMQGRWNELFFKNNNPIVLELGCGKGEYATGLARKYPDKNFIGIDIKGARMWTGAKEAIEEEITNVAFLRTHIELIDRFFSEEKYLKYGSHSPIRK